MPDPQTMMAMQLLQQILMGAGQQPDDMALMDDGPPISGAPDVPPGAQAAVGPPGIGTQAMPSPTPPGATIPPGALPSGPKRPPVAMPKGAAKAPAAPKAKAASRDRAPYKALGNKPKAIKTKDSGPRK